MTAIRQASPQAPTMLIVEVSEHSMLTKRRAVDLCRTSACLCRP